MPRCTRRWASEWLRKDISNHRLICNHPPRMLQDDRSASALENGRSGSRLRISGQLTYSSPVIEVLTGLVMKNAPGSGIPVVPGSSKVVNSFPARRHRQSIDKIVSFVDTDICRCHRPSETSLSPGGTLAIRKIARPRPGFRIPRLGGRPRITQAHCGPANNRRPAVFPS